MILIVGAVFGFISVAFGAFAEHQLRESVSEESFRFLMTAIRYNQVNAVLISAIGIALLSSDRLGNMPLLKWSGLIFIIGTALFSFSIYLSVSLKIPDLVYITPIGGVTIMAAWLLLIAAGWLEWKRQ